MSADALKASVLAAVDDFNAAWRDGNLEGLLAQFVHDADVLLFGSEQGEIARGPLELRRLLQYFFAEPVSYSWQWHRRDVFGSETLAWVAVEATIVEKGPDREVQAPYRFTGILEQRDGKWLWRLFHGSMPDPPHADWEQVVRPDSGAASP